MTEKGFSRSRMRRRKGSALPEEEMSEIQEDIAVLPIEYST